MNTATDAPHLAPPAGNIKPAPPASGEVGHPHVHESARLHVTGQASYTDDIAQVQGTLHAAFGLSPHAHARIVKLDFTRVRASEGVVAVFTAADIPGMNDCGPIKHDDPIFAQDTVHYVGQPVFLVVAHSHQQARKAARLADIDYAPLTPQLSPRAARDAGELVVDPMRLTRGDYDSAIAAAPRRLAGSLHVGGQEQFYLEGQIAYAQLRDSEHLHVFCSTQHPSEMQQVIAHALAWPAHRVAVECRRMGGGFGGKESQSAIWAAAAALAAMRLGKAVKLRADRDDDMMVTGKRHCFEYDYEVGYDERGRILAAKVDMVSRAGFSADLSGPVATRAVCHVDNAYYLSAVDIAAACARTNTQSNTAFRGFGGPQGAIAIEYIIDDIARELGLDPLDVRRINLYGRPEDNTRVETPYGQIVRDNVLHELMAQLERDSAYRQRRADIAEFNRSNPILKKGLALTPVKFGIAFNVTHLNQAGALVHVYLDGSILVNHGGTEMGQGVNTKVLQVVAHELGVSLQRVRISATDTTKIANTSATAASTGADLNGKAAQDAACQIRERLTAFAAQHYSCATDAIRFAHDSVHLGERTITFEQLVRDAYFKRVQLWSDGFYATPGLSWNAATMTGHPFSYFAYGAAVSEVTLDTLTGEWKLARVDALYDAGRSLNPALDKGQVEGAFIQGMGWLTMEELRWNEQGRLLTHAPSTYKIPAISDCPEAFHVALFENQNVTDSIHRSKAVGEPPLLLAFSVFFALRDAISAVDGHQRRPALRAPATCEAILDAVQSLSDPTA